MRWSDRTPAESHEAGYATSDGGGSVEQLWSASARAESSNPARRLQQELAAATEPGSIPQASWGRGWKRKFSPGCALDLRRRGEESGTQPLRWVWITGGAYGQSTEDDTAVAEAKVRRVRSRVKVSGKRVPSSRKGQAPQSSDESPRLVSVDSHQVRTQMSDGRCSPPVVLLCCSGK